MSLMPPLLPVRGIALVICMNEEASSSLKSLNKY